MLRVMLVIGAAWWGGGNPPPCGQVTYELPAIEPPGWVAWASPYSCRIGLSRDFMRARPRWKCAFLLHEVGHLYGHQHAAKGLMAPRIKYPPPLCIRLFPKI